jgi:hypothetical protein
MKFNYCHVTENCVNFRKFTRSKKKPKKNKHFRRNIVDYGAFVRRDFQKNFK